MYAMNIQNDVIGLMLRQNCRSKQVTDFIAWPSRCHVTIFQFIWNLFHQVRSEGTFFTTLEFISPGNLQEQISHQWNLCNIIFLWNMFYHTIHMKLFLGNFFHRNLFCHFWLTLTCSGFFFVLTSSSRVGIVPPSHPIFTEKARYTTSNMYTMSRHYERKWL